MDVFRTMIVPDAYVLLARQITETLAPVGGAGMYSTGLSPTGTEPATHWISSGFIDADYAALISLNGAGGSAETIVDMMGGAVSLEDVQALFVASSVTENPPFDDMSAMGLQLVQTETL
jgi:hypothetical protein